MAASFPSSVKSFGADRVNGDYVPASDANDVRAEIVAMEGKLLNGPIQIIGSTVRLGMDATNYVEVSAAGVLSLHGTAVVENDLAIGAHSLHNGATPPTWTAYNGTLYAPEFINAATTDLMGSFELLHDYKDGSDLTFHIHWSPSITNTGNCMWGLDYSICNINGTWAAPTTVTITPAASGVVRKHTLTDVAVISGAGLTKGATIDFRIYRLGANVLDTFTGSGYLHNCGIHYWTDKLGS